MGTNTERTMSNAFVLFIRFVFVDLLLDLVRFPAWWYSRGAVKAGQWYQRSVDFALDRLALKVLSQNLGRPMFGDYTREGRIISFFMRIIQLVVSSVIFLLWWVALTLLFFGYFLVPLAVLAGIAYELPHG